MTVMPISKERRSRRSEKTYQAIAYQLEHVLKIHGLRSFALSDSNGLVLARAGAPEEADALAAYAPVLAKCTDRGRRGEVLSQLGAIVDGAHEDNTEVRSFFVDGERLFLGLVGATGASLEAAIYRTLTGIRRIYRSYESA